MRFLYTMLPGISHLFPLVPLAQAMQAEGHEVLVATNGPAVKAAINAGLPAFEVAPGQDVDEPGLRLGERLAKGGLTDEEAFAAVGATFAEMGGIMLDGLVDAATRWRADAVVYMPICFAGLAAARLAGAKAVVHGIGHRNPLLWALSAMDPVARARGVDDLLDGADVEINISPSSLEKFNPDLPEKPIATAMVDLRHAPYNGGAELPPWALGEPDRPRVIATLGSSGVTVGGGELLTEVVAATADMDVELLLTSGGATLTALEALPEASRAHVRVVEWLPLRSILPSCSAIVHHAGSGSMFSAYAAGVPQIGIPHIGNASVNAEIAAKRGAGLVVPPAEATGEVVREALGEILGGASYRIAAQEVATEMAGMPRSSEVSARLTELLR
ncbi:glycosyltransferase [Amycolatopsis lurida]|uniref:Erythromycin biosynthesis protein CIII-like central domain-containing protein n=1 Tax=Amycolatopsis lurida NRRL 2430 TaxID=1460371 RepID=A0A2P2FW41_AMYLU|nr:nucleotide disphospho-sugar-binding domain-containing protein [Amycolatopsis lurida]KFU80939.1 hypothetical protein BB31_13400 [Amycolatopsis lurida NRRL 2430]SED90519.1 glycosyltransferase [Amycolatopsis lurida]